MKKQPKVVYANSINLSGLYSSKPMKCRLAADDDPMTSPEWYSEDEDFSVDTLGTFYGHGRITFTSLNKELAEVWTEGAKACMEQLKRWCIAHKDET